MSSQKMKNEIFIQTIQEVFDAELDEYVPTEDELQFIDARNRLEADPMSGHLRELLKNMTTYWNMD